jgi:hypothetical protein
VYVFLHRFVLLLFDVQFSQEREGLENWALSAPTVMGKYFCEYSIANEMWSHEERLSQLSCKPFSGSILLSDLVPEAVITFEDLSAHCAETPFPCSHSCTRAWEFQCRGLQMKVTLRPLNY